ncbi:MAG TPA: GAF domain-containing protein, partial [Dehalococcoidia bacterium]|nr:GAF domain-containing protein [Dehalococcoidia bacterium]
TQEEIDFLQTVAGQIAFAIENARLYEQTDQELQRRVEELTSLRGISNVIARTLDPKEMLDVIVRETGSLIRCDAATIFQLDDTDGRLRVIAARGLASDQDGPSELATGEGVIGRVIQTGQPATSSDLLLADRAPADESVLAAGFRALCCVPLRSRAGTIGGLVVYSRGPRPFTADEIALLRTFADETAVALENARLYEDARRNLAIKSALLAEMHHRVKNNLQTIASLLSLQARHAKSDEISAPLRESVVRIRSIAAVHELLSRGEIGITSFGDLVKQIVEVAATALVEPNVRITFEFAGEDTLFASREATTVALILTELINNAVLHGLEDCSEGVIRIAAGRQNGWATVSVHDSGRGLPPDFDLSTHGQLGLQIVQTLAGTDLAGTFALTGEAGCLASIRFPSPPPVLPAE